MGNVALRMKSVSEPRSLSTLSGEFEPLVARKRGGSGRKTSKSVAPPHRDPHAPKSDDLVYEMAPLAYLNLDARGRIIDFNMAASRILGLAGKSGKGRPLSDFIHPRDHHLLVNHVERSRASRKPVVTRLEFRPQGGPGATMELTTNPASEASCFRTRLVPISGHNPVAWPADDAKFRALVENSSEVICIGAPDGTVFYTTPSVKRVLGYEPASWFGRNAFEIMPPDQATLARLAVRQLAERPTGTVLRLTTQVRHANGSWKWVEAVLTNLINQPAIGGIVCNYRDVTDSRQAEQSLRASEQRYRLLTESLALQYAVVQTLAASAGIVQAAPSLLSVFCAQLGCEAGALWSRSEDRSRLDLVHLHQQPILAPADLFAASEPAPVKTGHDLAGLVWESRQPVSFPQLSARRGPSHHRAAAKLGLRRAFAFPIMRAREVEGVVELFSRNPPEPERPQPDFFSSIGIQIGLFIERTQALERLRQSEEALIQVNNALERRVSARTAELHTANHELSAEISERTRLEREIIRISEYEQRRIGQDLHDGVCQELAAIAFMTRALANRLDKNSSEETDTIHRVARLLNDSISKARDIARGLHPVEMHADGLMVALQDLGRRTHESIPCVCQCDEPILVRESDTALNLYRIAQEAVNNALKYSRASRITISLRRDDKGLRLSISDDGRGIPIGPAGRRGARNGMGLHIMRYRARSMGATLRIHDRRPRGTEVVCLLPPQ